MNEFMYSPDNLGAPIVEWDSNSFGTHGQHAGKLLRNAHALRDERRVKFLISLDRYIGTNDPTEEQYDALLSGGLCEALIDAALDRDVYENFNSKINKAEYLLLIFSCLMALMHHSVTEPCSHPTHKAGPKHPKWSKYLLDTFPRLWDMILEYPHLIKNDGCGKRKEEQGDDEGYRQFVVDLIVPYMGIYYAERQRYPSVKENSLPHVTMLLWAYCKTKTARMRLNTNLFLQRHASSLNEWNTFVANALTKRTIVPERFIARCRTTLAAEDLIDHELATELSNIGWLFLNPELRRVRGQDPDIAFLMCCAAQRQICSGGEEGVWEVLGMTFKHVNEMLAYDAATRERICHTREFNQYLIVLLARALVPAAMDPRGRFIEETKALIRVFIDGAETLNDPDPLLHGAVPEFRPLVHRVWHRAHSDLQAIPASRAPNRRPLLAAWRTLGRGCGIDVDAPYRPPPPQKEDSGEKPRPKALGCAWRDCLCFGERPYHKLRVCTRCKKVYYCSTKCQKRDWTEGGHKRACVSPKT